jgi:hypothetical protein
MSKRLISFCGKSAGVKEREIKTAEELFKIAAFTSSNFPQIYWRSMRSYSYDVLNVRKKHINGKSYAKDSFI